MLDAHQGLVLTPIPERSPVRGIRSSANVAASAVLWFAP